MKRAKTHPGEILALDYLGPLDVNARIGVVNRNTAERTRLESADIET
jgi:plasmid maintenance system antidote protein VapI